MRKICLAILLAALLGMILQVASAQNPPPGYPLGYRVTFDAPAADLHPLNYACTLTVYDATPGGLIATPVQARVDAYIIWVQPADRPVFYSLSYSLRGTVYWYMYASDTFDAVCHE